MFLLVAMVAGCDKAPTPAASPASGESARAPTPTAPETSPARDDPAARAAALAKGPGTCEEDVVALRVLPPKGQLGRDPHYDRMAVHPQAYGDCLLAMVRDRTPIEDPREGDKRTPFDTGALAYDLLFHLGRIEYGECMPASVMQQVESAGDRVIGQWLDDKNHRRQVHRCLAKRLGQ